MHALTCVVCNPLALRRRRKFRAAAEAASHVAFFERLGRMAREERQ